MLGELTLNKPEYSKYSGLARRNENLKEKVSSRKLS
jgi:hypothetical protein